MLQSISKADVPDYLRAGEFYKSLGDDEDDLITIPTQTTKESSKVCSLVELTHLLSSLRFWGVDKIPTEAFDFSFSLVGDEVEWHNLLVEFEVQFPQFVVVHKLLGHDQKDRMRCAIETGSYPLVVYLHELHFPFPREANVLAASLGNLDCLKYILAHTDRNSSDIGVCAAAALSGSLGCLKHARESACPWTATACKNAARVGSLSCLKYLHANGCLWDEQTCTQAAQCGQLECLKYAHKNGCGWSPAVCLAAALDGHLSCLQYAHEEGLPFPKDLCAYAVHGGHLECLQYAHNHGCFWNEETTTVACELGHLDCLVYAHTQGCPWSAEACIAAATAGHLQCLAYAREHGCPWNETAVYSARLYNRLDCVQYMAAMGLTARI